MAVIRVSDLSALTDDLQEVYQEASTDAIAEMVGPKVFKVSDTNRRTYDYQEIHGLSGIKKVAEGANLQTITTSAGDSATFTQAQYGAMVSITKPMRMFELYDQMEGMVRTVVEDAWQKVDQSMADVLLNGFSSSAYTDVYGESVAATGPDGLALFSASHSNNVNSTTFRNLIRDAAGNANPVLTRESVVNARVDAAGHKDVNGVNRPVKLDLLIVSPVNYDEALRITLSDKVSGSFENDVNPLKGMVQVKQWERLAARTGGTDTSAYWFMADSRKSGDSLCALFAERPSLDAPAEVHENKNWDYTIDYFYALGRKLPLFVWGSNASGS